MPYPSPTATSQRPIVPASSSKHKEATQAAPVAGANVMRVPTNAQPPRGESSWTKPSWLYVARISAKKMAKSRKSVEETGFKPIPRPQRPQQPPELVSSTSLPTAQILPSTIAIYFGGVPRGLIGARGGALAFILSKMGSFTSLLHR